MLYTKKPNCIADELRAFVRELEKLAEASSVFTIISPIIANTCDHILLRARYSDMLQEEPGSNKERFTPPFFNEEKLFQGMVDWVNEVTDSIDVDQTQGHNKQQED